MKEVILLEGTFKNQFEKFICDRTMPTSGKLYKDPRYLKYGEEEAIAFQKLKALVSNDMLELIFDYEAAITASMSCEAEYSYKQGLRDGVALLDELGLIKVTRMKRRSRAS